VTRLLLILISVLVVFAPAAEAAEKRTCRSGSTIYKRDGVRVFEDSRPDGDYWYACGPRSRRPAFLYAAEAGYTDLSVTGRRGDRVLFEVAFSGEGGGEQRTLGWFDARRSQARSGELAGRVSNEVRDVAVAADGSIGVVAAYEEDRGVRIGYLSTSRRRGELTDELVLSVAGGRYVKGSLAFAGRSLTWRIDSGETRSVPVAGEKVTCTSGTTVAESDGARVFEVFPRRKTDRGFQADVLAACPRGATTPRELAVSDVYDQDHWERRALKRAGSRTAFVVGDGGVGTIDGTGGDVRFRLQVGSWLSDIALGATGPLVVAADTTQGGQELADILRLSEEGATGFGRPVLLADGGDVVDGSLAVGDEGVVTWRTKDGAMHATPLAGLAAVDCRAGTTLLAREGLRVFAALPADAPDLRLYACPPDAAAPVEITGVSGSRTVYELQREAGRFALWLAEDDTAPQVVTFNATPGSARVGSPRRLAWYWQRKDVAIAADGRVAFAQRHGRKWRVSVFGLAGAGALQDERVIAKPDDGVKAGSLAFSADGTSVRWRNRAGTERGARL
jgi:hypothetical protein